MPQNLNVLQVLEHERIPVDSARLPTDKSISEEEADWLVRLNEDRRGFCTREYKLVRFAQFCGIVRLPTRTIEIFPKVSVGDPEPGSIEDTTFSQSRNALLFMLRYVSGFPFTQMGTAAQRQTDMPLLDVFIQYFLQQVAAVVKQGLLTAYVEHQDNLPFLRGRLAVAQHLRTNQRRPDRLYCAYDELTADNKHNQVLRHVLSVVRPWIHSDRLQQLWLELWPVFAEFDTKAFTADQVAVIPRQRLARHYDSLLVWCEWLLRLQSPALLTGEQHAPALLFNMNTLFEAYVTAAVRHEFTAQNATVEAHGQELPLAFGNTKENAFTIDPDVTVRSAVDGARLLIVDAKWKMLDPDKDHWGIAVGDMYQMLAYAIAGKCRSIRLAYPWLAGIAKPAQWPKFDIPIGLLAQHTRVTVEVQLYRLDGFAPATDADADEPSQADLAGIT